MNKKGTDIQAYGKIILLGEHSVVYDRPALAVGIKGGVILDSIEPAEGPAVLDVPDWDLSCDDTSSEDIGLILRIAKNVVGGRGFKASFSSRLPVGAGLGSSAALSVALVEAAAHAAGKKVKRNDIRVTAHLMEKVFHGTPSGLDDTLAAYGGLCLFRKDGWEENPVSQFLGASFDSGMEILSPEAVRIDARLPSLVLGHSGEISPTRKMVAMVREKFDEDTEGSESLFDEISELVKTGALAVISGDDAALGNSMLKNHQLLYQLGLSTDKLDAMVDMAVRNGAVGAKLTGGGGGGCAVALAPGREREVASGWKQNGYECWIASENGLEAF